MATLGGARGLEALTVVEFGTYSINGVTDSLPSQPPSPPIINRLEIHELDLKSLCIDQNGEELRVGKWLKVFFIETTKKTL